MSNIEREQQEVLEVEREWMEMTRLNIAGMWKQLDFMLEKHVTMGERFWQVRWGLTEQTIRNYLSVARTFSPNRRPKHLSVGHCMQIQGCDQDKQDALIAWGDTMAERGERPNILEFKAKRGELEGRPPKEELTWETTRRKLHEAELRLVQCEHLLRRCRPHLPESYQQEVDEWLLSL